MAHTQQQYGSRAVCRCCDRHRKICFLMINIVIFMVTFSLIADTYLKFDPLYVPILCNSTDSSVETTRIPFSRGGGIQVQGNSTMVCRNPNRMILRQEPLDNFSQIYFVLGNETTEVGQLPATARFLAAQTDTKLTSQIDFKIDASLLMKVARSGQPVLIATESNALASISVNLYGLQLHTWPTETTSWCGHYQEFGRSSGPMACANSLEALKLKAPPVGSQESPVVPFEVGIPQEKVMQVERVWNIACYGALVLLFGMIVASLSYLVFLLRAAYNSDRKDSGTTRHDNISDTTLQV